VKRAASQSWALGVELPFDEAKDKMKLSKLRRGATVFGCVHELGQRDKRCSLIHAPWPEKSRAYLMRCFHS
jgi:hypothetical protein